MVLRRQIEPERWERRLSQAELDRDLDPDEVAAAMGEDIQRAGSLVVGSRGPVEVLERLGLVSHGRLTNGGDVLFARHPAARHPQARVRAVCFPGDKTDAAYRDLKMLEGPLVRVLDQAFAFIQHNTASGARFDPSGLKREDLSLYPRAAVREGLVNAFAHRDYSDFRGGIAVSVYPRRLEIWNSGPFPDGITPETVAQGHISILRNPDIAHVLYLRGMMEKLARGGVLIRSACAEQNLPPPQWRSEDRGVTLTFFAPEATQEVTPEVTPEPIQEVAPEVGAVLGVIAGEMSRRELQDRLGLKDPEHFRKRYLLPALEQGLVEMTLPDKPNSSRQRYRLTELGRRYVRTRYGAP
jgi:ATP-dependent DNA helicase RecG